MSRLQKAEPANAEDLQNFAYDLGEHCQSFNNHIQYKQFVKDLIKAVAQDLSQSELEQVRGHVARLATKRIKEEKTGQVTHVLVGKQASDDDDAAWGVYDDFM